MSVSLHADDNDVARQLALRIREERRRRGWTLRDIASRVSVSVATLSAIENQQVSPDVRLLLQLSEALGTRLETLLPRSRASHVHITRRSDIAERPSASLNVVSRNRRRRTGYHNRLWPLADAFVGRYLDPYEIEIHPVRDDQLHFISHTHEEFLFVLRGRMEVLIKSSKRLLREKLGPGDCMYFASYLPHCIRSTTKTPARSIHVLYSLDEPADSETADSGSGPVVYMMEAAHRSPADVIADKIASLRRTRGISAVTFAKQLGISVRRLARIERGDGPLSLKLLLHIRRTLRKPLAHFLTSVEAAGDSYFVDRAADLRRRPKTFDPDEESRDVRCCGQSASHPLASGFRRRGMLPFLMTLTGSCSRSSRMVRHPGQEFVYVLDGAVDLRTIQSGERTDVTLSAGDSCFISSSAPHRFAASSVSPYDAPRAEMMVVRWHHKEPH
jgi:transcriptional regulator with XRE-family HTH domain